MKSRVNQVAKITKIVCPDGLADVNRDNDTMRAVLHFTYAADDKGVMSLLASIVTDSSNQGNIIIDVSTFEGNTFDEKLASACDALVGQEGYFTTYVFDIADLNENGETVVNNGKRVYRSLSQHYLGDMSDVAAAQDTVHDRLLRQISDGTLYWGDLEEEEEEERREERRPRRR